MVQRNQDNQSDDTIKKSDISYRELVGDNHSDNIGNWSSDNHKKI
jgi:hypothetical protein